MTFNFSKISAFFLAAALLISTLPVSVGAAESTDTELFGRTALASLDNGDELVKAYDRIADGAKKRLDTIDLKDCVNINVDELSLVMEAYFNDPHGHFWIEQGYTYASYSSGRIVYLVPNYNSLASSENELQRNIDTFEAECKSILKAAGVRDSMSDYEKEKRIHDAFIKRVVYRSGLNCHNEFGAIVEGVATCRGYTLAFNYLLRLCGIKTYTVHGIAGGSHCWSLVQIDGKYYHTDVTWADPVGGEDTGSDNDIFYSYFNVSDSVITRDHIITPASFPLPQCNSNDASYYTNNPKTVFAPEFTPEDMAQLYKDGMVRVYVEPSHFESFNAWLSSNAYSLFSLTGYDLTKPMSFSVTYLLDEYHVYLEGTHTEPEITYSLGDLNGDGGVDAKDSNMLLQIIAGAVSPTDIQKTTGDINGDGEINAKDSNLMKRIISGSLII